MKKVGGLDLFRYGLDLIKNYRDVIYKTSNGQVGTTAHLIQPPGPFGRSCKFSNHLAKAGNYINNGMNTVVDRERYLDQSKDWMTKNL